MSEFIQYALLGLGVGAGYALLAQGLVVVQTGSGVINFAHGAFAMIGAFTFYALQQRSVPTLPAIAICVVLVAVIGLLTYELVMRPLRRASPLSRVIGTLGVLLVLQAVGTLIWGQTSLLLFPVLPVHPIHLGGGVALGEDKFIMFGVAVVLTVLLDVIYRFTLLGISIRGAAENERAAGTLGVSSRALARITWAAGGALAAGAGILIAAIAGLQVDALTLLVIPTLAAALAGGFTSFWLTLMGGVIIGMCQSLLTGYVSGVSGISTALPFAIIIVLLVIRGKSLPVRDTLAAIRLPELGTGRINWKALAVVLALFVVLSATVFPVNLLDAVTVSLAWSTVLLSVVVLMGYTGQLDLAPLAWGGLAALVAGRLVAEHGVPFELALVIGVLAAIPLGLLFALPALRARGLNLAVVTLGLGVMVHALIFTNDGICHCPTSIGLKVGAQSFLGVNVGSYEHPFRYLILTLAFFVLAAIVVANLRRGGMGRRMIAVRTNERAASALGISVFGTKLYAFALSATVAALGGVLLGFELESLLIGDRYDPVSSILAAAYAVLGGVGFLAGPLVGSTFAPAGVGSWIMDELFPGAAGAWLTLIAGVSVIGVLLQDPDGAVAFNIKSFRKEVARVRRISRRLRGLPAEHEDRERTRREARERSLRSLPTLDRGDVQLSPKALDIAGLTVRYGGVTAVDDVSLSVAPGKVVGLIGPNGAGKTSLIDAVTGFTRPAAGRVLLAGEPIDHLSVDKRARLGVCRSFQSLELFEGSTVRENIQVAADRRDGRAYLTDLIAPSRTTLSPVATLAIHEVELGGELDTRVDQLSYGARRLTAIARTIAVGPAVLLIDEPAAGLSQRESADLASILRRLADDWGLGILLVEHDMKFVMSVCDHLVVLDFGHKIAEGPPSSIRNDPAVIAAYLGAADESPPAAKAPAAGGDGSTESNPTDGARIQ